jgi:hypothetical protein
LFAFSGFGLFLTFVIAAGHAVLRRARLGARYTEIAEKLYILT